MEIKTMNKTLIASIFKALEEAEKKPRGQDRDALVAKLRESLKLAIKFELRK
jgi:hypothetical protein